MINRKTYNKVKEMSGYKCELCGDIRALEVHHSIPKSVGGTDDIDNLICVCGKCHAILHRGNRSQLTKIGLHKHMLKWKINHFQLEFYKHFNDMVEKQNAVPNFIDACDFIDDYFTCAATKDEVTE